MYKINESRLVKDSVLNGGKPNIKVYAREDRYRFAGANEVEIYVNNGTAFKFDCNEAEQANLSLLELVGAEDKFKEQVMNAVTTAIENCIKDAVKSFDVKKAISVMVDNVMKVEKEEKISKEDTIAYVRETLPKKIFSIYAREFEDELRKRGYGDVIGDRLL